MVAMNHKHVYNKLQVVWSDTWLIGGFDTTCVCVYLFIIIIFDCLCDVICHGVIDFFSPPLKREHGLCGCLTSGTIRHVYNSLETKR